MVSYNSFNPEKALSDCDEGLNFLNMAHAISTNQAEEYPIITGDRSYADSVCHRSDNMLKNDHIYRVCGSRWRCGGGCINNVVLYEW